MRQQLRDRLFVRLSEFGMEDGVGSAAIALAANQPHLTFPAGRSTRIGIRRRYFECALTQSAIVPSTSEPIFFDGNIGYPLGSPAGSTRNK